MKPVTLHRIIFDDGYEEERALIDQIELEAELDQLQGQWEEATDHDMEAVQLDLGLFFDDLRRIIGVL